MTVTSGPLERGGDPRRPALAEGADPVEGREATTPPAIARAICPYLAGEDGSWRSAVPLREQRCGAVNPPAPLTLEKQRRLCLVNAHMTCATYRAARGIEIGATRPSAAAIAERVEGGVTRWSLARTAPLLLDQGRVASVTLLARRRTGAQLALGALMALALGAIILARLPRTADNPSVIVGVPSPSATVLPSPSTTTRPTPRPTLRPTPSPSLPSASPGTAISSPVPTVLAATATPAAEPSAAPPAAPSAERTWVVQSGDTLYAIALNHGTTVEAIQAANGMGQSTHLDIGQVLIIP